MKRILRVLVYLAFLPALIHSQAASLVSAQYLNNLATQSTPGVSGTSIQDGIDFKPVAEDPTQRTVLAMTTEDYPVTPGDLYTLTYLHSYTSSSITILVESDYTVNLSLFGKLNARGMRFTDLKRQVESIVLRSYKDSLPQLAVQNVGTYQVMVKGEVNTSGLVSAWGLARVSNMVAGKTTAYSSIRNVEVRDRNGVSSRYDLFRASRLGDMSQDPYIRPGDTIILSKIERKVTVSGEVRRPGTYQLLPGENISSLVHLYGDGFTELADSSRIQVTRRITGLPETQAETFLLSRESARFETETLKDLDTVSVSSRMELLPVMFFEGAVNPDGGVESGATAGVMRYRLKSGDSLFTVLKSVKDNISKSADLSRAYLTRADDPTQREINLEKLIYGYDPKLDISLKEGDRIVIPFGKFEVFITGEVKRSAWVGTGALTRLSAAVGDFLTDYSSIRDIEVVSAAGESRVYDLFRASRLGEREQDPYLNPGDTVRIRPLQRKVTVSGEVQRPGTYQLLPGEEVNELINFYAQGFSKMADPQRTKITRYDTGRTAPVETIYFYLDTAAENTKLRDLDVVEVDRKTDYLPIIFFEGAVGAGIGDNPVAPDAANKFPYRISEGELLSTIVRRNVKNFTTVSDLKNSYIVRVGKDQPIPVDLERLMYSFVPEKDIVMQANDVVIVPFRQYFVTVSGAVMGPGRYPYVPDRSWKYYVNLAGGFDPDKNAWESVRITNKNDLRYDKNRVIQPEDKIFAATNNPLYHFGKTAGIISAIMSVVAIVINLMPNN